MKLQELIDEIKVKNPQLFDNGLTDKQATQLISAAFRLIGKRVDETQEGKFSVNGLGLFVVRTVVRGEESKSAARRVVRFRSSRQADRLPG